jgi:hypothetical protein
MVYNGRRPAALSRTTSLRLRRHGGGWGAVLASTEKDAKIDYLVRVASTDGRVGTQMSETGRRVDVDLGWVLQCGGFFLDWVELAVLEPGDKSMVYRIKEVCVQNIPSRCAPPEWR